MTKLTVERAAILIDGRVYDLPRPNRHHDIIQRLVAMKVDGIKRGTQGFVLSNGAFVPRDRAAALALENGQVTKLRVSGRLFTEDLW